MLADFGLAKRLQNAKDETETFCGTPEYMAPEILGRIVKKSTKHGLAVDWWAVGILTYEMMIGHTPFYQKKHHDIWKLIRTSEPKYPGKNHPEIPMSDDCKDFIARCLDKKPDSRLGSSNDVQEVLNHPWLDKINVTNLLKKRIKAPFIPSK